MKFLIISLLPLLILACGKKKSDEVHNDKPPVETTTSGGPGESSNSLFSPEYSFSNSIKGTGLIGKYEQELIAICVGYSSGLIAAPQLASSRIELGVYRDIKGKNTTGKRTIVDLHIREVSVETKDSQPVFKEIKEIGLVSSLTFFEVRDAAEPKTFDLLTNVMSEGAVNNVKLDLSDETLIFRSAKYERLGKSQSKVTIKGYIDGKSMFCRRL